MQFLRTSFVQILSLLMQMQTEGINSCDKRLNEKT